MSCGKGKQEPVGIGLPTNCCTGTTGCSFDGNLRRVKAEPVYVQKVYDTALFNLQGLKTATNQGFGSIRPGSTITRVLAIRCKKFFNPKNIKDKRNLVVDPHTTLSGAQFVEDCGKPVRAVGPDGFRSEKLVYVDTQDCDDKCKGTPIFGTQSLEVSGNVIIEIDAIISDNCRRECRVTLEGLVEIGKDCSPLVLTNFFELCVPSVTSGAFLPRFTEFCNIKCEPRLATNNILRDISVNPETGAVNVNLIISLCITCEKKIVVPVQLCVLSTGFPQLSPEISPICDSFPALFPNQIDKDSVKECLRERESERESERDSDCGRRRPGHCFSQAEDSDDVKGLKVESLDESDDIFGIKE